MFCHRDLRDILTELTTDSLQRREEERRGEERRGVRRRKIDEQ